MNTTTKSKKAVRLQKLWSVYMSVLENMDDEHACEPERFAPTEQRMDEVLGRLEFSWSMRGETSAITAADFVAVQTQILA